MGRQQKYLPRSRHLYALLFDNAHCYVGQSINLHRRAQQHAHRWPSSFRMIELGAIEGTQAQAEEHEYAWRYTAAKAGWRVYGQTIAGDIFIVDPYKRMTWSRRVIARRLRWPSAERLNSVSFRWLLWPAIALLALVLSRWL